MENALNDSMLIASVIFLVVSLVTCMAVSVTGIVTVLVRNTARIKAIFDSFWQINRTSTKPPIERMYDDVIDSSPPVRLSIISTRHNVAYGQKPTA